MNFQQIISEALITGPDGKPQTFYHGTKSHDIRRFEIGFNSYGHKRWKGNHQVVSFATNPEFANGYAGRVHDGDGQHSVNRATVYPVHIDVDPDKLGDFRNPEHVKKVMDHHMAHHEQFLRHSADKYHYSKNSGFDINTEEGIAADMAQHRARIEPQVKHGAWMHWEGPGVMKAHGWDAVYTREELNSNYKDHVNLAVRNPDCIKMKFFDPDKKYPEPLPRRGSPELEAWRASRAKESE